MKRSWYILTIILICLAFIAGRFSGGTVARAAADDVRVEVRPIGGSASLLLHYPERNRVYIYNNAFTGYPKSSCAYYFQLSVPGGTVTRHQCPQPESQ